MSRETIKIILVVLVFLYAVSVLERGLWNRTTEKQNEAYKQEKAEYEKTIESLKTKLYQHEINLIKSNAAVDGYSNDQLDSAWTAVDWTR